MAEDRTFTLIGNFTDNITPSLEKINNSIDSLKRNLSGFGGKKGSFNDLTRSMGKVIGAHIKLNEQVKDLRSELTKSIPVLREYRKEVGKTVGANMMLQGKGNKQRFVKSTNPTLQFLDEATRRTRELATASRGVRLGGRMPRDGGGGGQGGGGGGGRPPRPARVPAGGGGNGGGYGGGGGGRNPRVPNAQNYQNYGVSRDAYFAFGQTLGYQLGNTVSGAVVQGFQIGVGLMMKPFQYLAGAMQERIRDELSDISAAGGLLSVAKRQKGDPLVKNFQASMDLTQQTNKYMAEIAAALPGNTQQYIEVGKRMSDTVARMISMDSGKAIAYAKELAAKDGDGRIIATQKDAYTQIVGNFATQGVLAGLGDASGGGGSGARGLMGAYGLPQLMERMMNDQEVSMGQFQRYAAIFRDPKIMEALERFIPKINETMKGTVDRARVFDKFFEEVLPPEMIRAFERSTAGILEAFKTAIGGPETGFFGLGRKIANMGKKMDAYGNYLNAKGEITTYENAVNEALSFFDMMRDIFANISIALYPLVEILPQIFDPIKNITKLFIDVRHISGQFLKSFESYSAGMDLLSKTTKKGNIDFAKTKKARAAMLAITNFMTDIGAFTEGQFTSLSAKITGNPSDQLGVVLNEILKTFFESDAAGGLGDLIGSFVGTTLKQVATVLEYFLGIATTSKLASGIKSGFAKAGGYEAAQSIMTNIFKGLLKLVTEIFMLAPAQFTAIGAVALLMPAFMSSFSIMLANWLEGHLTSFNGQVGKQLNKFSGAREVYKLDKAKPRITGDVSPLTRKGAPKSAAFRAIKASRITNPQFPGVGLGVTPGVGGVTGPFRAPGIPKGSKVTPPKGFKVQIVSVAKNAMSGLQGLPGRMGAGGMAGLKNPIGMLGKFGGALTVVTGVLSGLGRILSGGSIFEGLGAAAGPIIGTIIGTALLGPLGGLIGSWVGQQESVVNGLANIFENLAATFGTLTQFALTLAKDIGWLASKFFGLGEDFDWLGGLMRALEAPFYYMRLGMLGIYELYLKATGRSKSPEADALRAERVKLEEENRLRNTLSGMYKGYSPEEKLRGLKGGLQASTRDLAIAKAEGSKAGVAMATAQIEVYKQEIAKIQKPGAPATPSAAKPGAPAAAQVPAANPAAVAAQAQAVTATATNTQQLNQKAATQVTHAAGIKSAAVKTQANTTTANTTLGNIRAGMMVVSNKLSSLQSAILGDLNNIQAGVTRISSLLASGSLKVKTDTPFFPGAHGVPMGGASGSLGAAQSLASQNGLGLTSYFRAGDKGMHGVGRAMDFSNGVNTPQQMAFAQQMISRYGSSLAELIYTPLGFGIKNGQKVPLSYWGERTNAMHYNHVHVAFAKGKEDGKMFSSQKAAGGWENSMVPGSVKIASVTANSGDGGGFGALTIGDINLTVNAGNVSDPDQLASIVAIKIGEAVADARAASIFV